MEAFLSTAWIATAEAFSKTLYRGRGWRPVGVFPSLARLNPRQALPISQQHNAKLLKAKPF